MRVTYKSVQLSTPIDVQISTKKHKKHGKHGKISPPKVHNFVPTNSKDTEVDEVPDKEFKKMRIVKLYKTSGKPLETKYPHNHNRVGRGAIG
jgi:hypothetical protein